MTLSWSGTGLVGVTQDWSSDIALANWQSIGMIGNCSNSSQVTQDWSSDTGLVEVTQDWSSDSALTNWQSIGSRLALHW